MESEKASTGSPILNKGNQQHKRKFRSKNPSQEIRNAELQIRTGHRRRKAVKGESSTKL